MKQYEKYKDSGVEWLGEIPEHWEVEKLKFSGKIYAGLSGKSGVDFSKEPKKNHKPYIPFTNIYNNTVIDVNDYHFVKIDEYEQQNYVKNNDLLFLMSSETLEDIGKNALFKDKTSVFLNSFCKGFRIYDKNVYPEYLNYLLLASPYREYFAMVARGFTRINLKQEYVLNMPILKLDLKEQQKIATFLDEKTAKIDKAIELKERTIALLKERKQIVIQDLVTGKKVWNQEKQEWTKPIQVKDSGVEWIGEIPKEWEVKRLKYLGNIISGYTFPSNNFKAEGIRVLKISNIQTMNIDWTEESFVDEKYYSLERFRIHEGDLIFALTRPIISTGIKATIVPAIDEKLMLNQRNAVLKPNNRVLNKWLYYIILDNNFKQEFNNQIDFTGQQPNISPFDIGNISIPLLSLEGQNKIVSHIETQITKIDRAISLQEQAIEKLKELKATLIDSAVTGKMKVNEK